MTALARIRAIDRFIKGLKEDNLYTDLQAACVMAGWDSLAGALTPLVGASPTNNGFLDADLDRGIGLTGDGSSKYLDSNRANEEDDQDSHHLAVFQTSPQIGNPKYIAGRGITDAGTTTLVGVSGGTNKLYTRSRNSGDNGGAAGLTASGLLGMSRGASDNYDVRVNSNTSNTVQDSQTTLTGNAWVYRSNNVGSGSSYDGTLSFYSIGSATDLEALDARVSTLMADLRAIEEAGFDRDAIGYLRAVEEADGAFLETSVKVAVNNLVSGLKADGLWNAIGSSCLLCGPRTLAGALVPLKGDAPTAYGFVAGDHFRDTGLKGDGTSYLNSNRANDADPQNDFHISAYATTGATGATYFVGAQHATSSYKGIGYAIWSRSAGATASSVPSSTGLYAVTRDSGSAIKYIKPPSGVVSTSIASVAAAPYATNDYAFALSDSAGSPIGITDAKLAFYSIGTAISDLAKLDSHVSAYVTAIGAAL